MSVVVLDENRWQKILAFLPAEDRVNMGKEGSSLDGTFWCPLALSPGYLWSKFTKDFIGGVVLGCGNV